MTKLKTLYYCLVVGLMWIGVPRASAIQIEDTYTRADGTELGVTEVGGYSYAETGTTTGAADVAEIFGGQVIVFGTGGFFGSGPGLAMFDDANFADVSIAADMRFEGLISPTNPGSNNFGGFILRRNGTTTGFGATNEGQVEVMMLPGGGIFIREVKAGVLNLIYNQNPFGLGGTANNLYSAPGQLPITFNGLPFDANNSGMLEDGEQFRFGANLVGNALEVTVNGLAVANVMTTLSAPTLDESFIGLYKNRYTSASGLDAANIAFDNVVISGTEYIPPPPLPIIHVGDTNPLSEGWAASNSGTVGNNGPIDDNGTAAWNINDDSATARAGWTRSLRSSQVDAALSEGWSMKASINVLGLDDVPDGGIELSVYTDSTVGYTLWFGADSAGNPTVSEFGGLLSEGFALGRTATVTGTGFHDYEMVYDPNTQTVDVFADGGLILDDMLAIDRQTAGSLNRILWGSNAGSALGNANYSFVKFTIGAEESLPGDYNNDGFVNAADYALWRDKNGSSETLANDDIGGTIGQDHYAQWRQNFGATGSGSGLDANGSLVPEPSCLGLLAAALITAFVRSVRTK